MWRIDLDQVNRLKDSPIEEVEWELVKTNGIGPGKISHHTCFTIEDTMVLVGGQQGEDDNGEIFKLDLKRLTWGKLG